jgi:hypothetical protein
VNWGDVYALIATSCGYGWDAIDAMTLPAVNELFDYWLRHPPAHLLLAAAFQFKPKAPPPRSDFSELAALAPEGVLKHKG